MGGLTKIKCALGAMPELIDERLSKESPLWIVTVYDNDTNTYEEVIFILVVATQCTQDEAYIEAWEIDNLGKSVVHQSTEDECKRVAEVVSTIGLRTEVSQEL